MKPPPAPRAPVSKPGRIGPLAALVLLGGLATGCAAPAPGTDARPLGAPSANGGGATASTSAPDPSPSAAQPGAARAQPSAGSTAQSRPGPRRSGAPFVRAAGDDETGPLPSVDLNAEILFQLLASEIAAQRGQTGNATATYLALARKTADPRLARRATELALSERSLERAVQAAQLWRELAPESALAAQTLETLWLSTGRLTDARPLVAERLTRARADNTIEEAYGQLQATLMRSADKASALAFLEELAAGDPQVPQARLALAALARAAGQGERAAIEATRALALRPDDEMLAVTAARYLQASPAGNPAALRVLQAYLERFPKALEARFQYAMLLSGEGRNDDARREMERALREDPDSPVILFSLAQLAHQNRQIDAADGYLKRFLALPPSVPRDNNPAYLFLSQIAEERQQLPKAIEWLEKVGAGEQAMPALLRRAVLMARSGRLEAARELLRGTTAATNRERVQLISAEAQLLRDANRGAEAFEILDQALQRLPNNPELLYDQAMAAERIDRLEAMEKSLRKLIELKPDHAHAYNALGYSLAERGLRLPEAQTLIEQALKLLPDDGHILDSMGWVLYRRGQLEQATDFLVRAYQQRPEADIAAHLGEVLWKRGRLDEARRLWAEARSREPDNQTLKETLARLNVAL